MKMVEEGENQHEISQKRMKTEEFVEEGGEDRISGLPDCLIVEILSRLPSTKYAIRTGALSKRWEHVWTWVPTLSFTDIDYVPFAESHGNPKSRSDFFSLVDKTLTQCRQPNLKKFQVRSCYDVRFESHVNNWIRYAINHGVEELYSTFYDLKSGVKVLLDQSVFTGSCLRDLKLQGCKLNPTGPIIWKNLRSLFISGNLDKNLIENILSGSPVLETLELGPCYGFRRLDITSKSLKTLVFCGLLFFYGLFDNDIIEINAPNLLSLTMQTIVLPHKLSLLNVSSLVEAILDYESRTTNKEAQEEMLKELILNLGHVKELKIGSKCSKVVSRLEAKGFMFPSNVKFVERSAWLV